ncbi:probable glucan 1,3-beta-glucosidase A isoform X4 [Beta vulgaris subsp. vulgaris]|uniref:probable glucan 1,3-beta-glucosidase A isoform X4 n=1 Tax=Beta vulgaris subsp. vulgaris TaxID=3555 RepID=UPI002547BCB0|nr:probable glucan 1,3-beta-glucosidase A isoform X4 [Beta vulgaris subsp. vulgaris]
MEFLFHKWVFAFLFSFWLLFSIALSVEGLKENSKVRGVNLGGWLVIEGWIKPSLFDGIPNADMLDGTEVQFKSVTLQKYVSAENGGGSNVTVSRDIPSSWETFRLWRVSQMEFQLRSTQGQFWTCDFQGSSVSATTEAPGTNETFYIERLNNSSRIHIKLQSGIYLQEHRSSFITIGDFYFLSRHGINAVRIPVGWWIAYDPDPPAPFIGGSLAALDDAFSWAEEYNIKCIIDLHAAPGSQNGMEHSSSRDGSVDWPTSQDNINKTLDVIDFLASRYAKNPALLGIELLNEPSAAGVPLDIMLSYYQQGYRIVRKYSSSAYVIVCQRIGNADPLELYQANIGSTNVVVDLHYYNLFDTFFVNMNSSQNVDYIYKTRETQLQQLNNASGPLVFIGEWVNEWNVESGSKQDYKNFGKAQLDVYNAASFGWAYWTLKNDRKHWDFEWNIRKNYLEFSKSSSPGLQASNVVLFLVLTCSYLFLYQIL